MIYLLDVNALLALSYERHAHHSCTELWLHTRRAHSKNVLMIATCAITELGFVRVASGSTRLAHGVATAQSDLRRLKAAGDFVFISDDDGAERLPVWVTGPEQTTDGHLLELARKNGAKLATLDRGIPGAELIPPVDGWRVEERPAIYGAAA